MMTVNEFILRYHGTFVDFDGQYGDQCVDLYRFYVKEVLGLPQSPGVVGAAEIYTDFLRWPKALRDKYVRVPNLPNNIPVPGDIIVWPKTYGPFGHVAIFQLGDVNKFIALSQNDPRGSLTHLQDYKYTFGVRQTILGWLHPLPPLSSLG